MIFAKQQKTPVQAFNLSLSNHSPTAFGPGSVINGSLVLELSKSVKANDITVVFDCREREKSKCIATIFSVRTNVWSAKGKNDGQDEIENGRHLFLFAVKLPPVNYPPSITEPQFGLSIDYTLQAFFNTNDLGQVKSNTVPIIYYPLVNSQDLWLASSSDLACKTERFQVEKDQLSISLKCELTKPSYCPGDVCVVRTTMRNPTEIKISHVQVSLIATTKLYQGTLTPLSTQDSEAPINPSNSQTYKNITQTLYSESVYITMPKKGHDAHYVFRVFIPKDCPPSTGSHISGVVDRSYEVVIKLPLSPNQSSPRPLGKWPFSGFLSASKDDNLNQTKPVRSKEAVLSLPVHITTVPSSQTLPPQLKISLPSFNEQPELPTFIEDEDSPEPSPISPLLDDCWSLPGSPLSTSIEGKDALHNIEDVVNAKSTSNHLMVPKLPNAQRSSVSTSSSSSTDMNHSNHDITQDSNSQVLGQVA
ncbi:hypothetical protein BGW37DRAFT_499849 [Umbelopsis sp. PMI_123]|nr:hypothetical protein BGW37DRAFT_499849 [Umbelopsis sp. PMI_123]